MPGPITAAKGQINLVLENPTAPGMQPLITNQAIGASMTVGSLPTVPATGSRLVLWFMGASVAGTFTITGTDLAGNALTEGPVTIPQAPVNVQSNMVGKFEYVTTKIYGAVTSIATTGATGAIVTVFTIAAAKYLVPCTLKSNRKFDTYSPDEHRNLLDRDTNILQLINKTTLDDITQSLYPENSMFIPYMLCGDPQNVVTLPASPTSLLAAAAVTGTPLSLTTQPTYPGMVLIATVTGASSGGTITFTGHNQFGLVASEVIKTAGNGTYYSSNVYSDINASGVATTGMTGGSVAIGGVFGFKYTAIPQDVVYSACIEKFDGVDSYAMPWTLLDQFDLTYDQMKELTFTGKGIAQDRLVIGDRTVTTMNTNQVTALGQPMDMPIVGWNSQCFLDPSVATIGTNAFGDMLSGKISMKSPQTPGYTSTQSQNFNRVNRGKRSTSVDAKIDLTNVLQLEKFRQSIVQYFTMAWFGQPIGGGYSKSWQISTAVHYDDFAIDSMPNQERVEASLTMTSIYDPNLGGSYQLTIISQQPPIYTK